MLLPRELDMIATGKHMPLPVPKPNIPDLVEISKQEQGKVGSADEDWRRQVWSRKPATGDCATGSDMDCGRKSVPVPVMSKHLPTTGRGPAGSNQEQQGQQQRAQPQGMHGRGRDQQQPVTPGRGPQQKQPAQTTERRVPQQKQPPPATEGRGG
jgi:hypothetical protein